jgi:photosystem II stability/assembly factor-like uncharacterized protein
MKKLRSNALVLALTGLVLGGVAMSVNADTTTRLAKLAGETHFHGIAVDANDPTRLYLATHHGFFLVTTDGNATRLSNNGNDYMGFTPHPTDPSVFYASGHPASGGNTGFIESRDGGRSWHQLSAGVGGPVDFHQMDVSRADPKTIYGVFRGLQVSQDGGHTWTQAAQTPPKLIDLAASASDVNVLYAATEKGLLVSTDRGQTWKPAHLNRSPATMVQAANDGSVYAFVWGLGLLRSPDDSLGWQVSSNAFGDRYLLHLAVDPSNAENLYAITNKTEVLASQDGGVTWEALR